MGKKGGIIGVFLIAAIIVGYNVFHWAQVAFFKPEADPKIAYEQMAKAKTLVIKGNMKEAVQKPNITADGMTCGQYVEEGILNAKFAIECSGTRYCYYAFGSADLTDKEPIANTFIDYDDKGNIIGYAQETGSDVKDTPDGYVYLFYDADKNLKPYYLVSAQPEDIEEGWSIRNEEGEELVAGEMSYSVWSSDYTITLTCSDEGSVDLYDKMLIVTSLLDEMHSHDYYND